MPTPKAAIAGKIVNRNELAGILGCASMTVARYVAAGMPVIDPGAHGRAAQFNELVCRDWVEARKRLKSSPPATDARQRFTLAAAELKEFQLGEKRGSMLSVDEFAPIVADELANVRSRLLEMPSRIAARLVEMSDAGAIEGLIRGEVIAALSELSCDQKPPRATVSEA